MHYITAFGMKWIIVAIVTFSLFAIFQNVTMGQMFMISLTVTGISYVLGDLLLLPRIGNIFATIADFGLFFILFAFLGNGWIQADFPITLASLAAAFILSFTESLFHVYLQEHIFQEKQVSFPVRQLQTEIAEEIDPDLRSKNKRKNKSPR